MSYIVHIYTPFVLTLYEFLYSFCIKQFLSFNKFITTS